MTDFADGLQLSRMHPPNMIVFLQGLPRRVDERLVASAAAGDPDPEHNDQALESIYDTLTQTAVALKESGFAPDTEVRDHAQPAIAEDPELSRLNAAVLEVARRVAGVPDSEWTDQPELLALVRQCCADVAEALRSIGEHESATAAEN